MYVSRVIFWHKSKKRNLPCNSKLSIADKGIDGGTDTQHTRHTGNSLATDVGMAIRLRTAAVQ
jgi:hypothetical protein